MTHYKENVYSTYWFILTKFACLSIFYTRHIYYVQNAHTCNVEKNNFMSLTDAVGSVLLKMLKSQEPFCEEIKWEKESIIDLNLLLPKILCGQCFINVNRKWRWRAKHNLISVWSWYIQRLQWWKVQYKKNGIM